MPEGQRVLVNLGASHHTAPIEVRERFAVAPEKVTELYRRLKELPGVREAAVLSTCNRTELYAVVEDEHQRRAVLDSFCSLQALDPEALSRYGFERCNKEAVEHLFHVASGLDSLVVGEAEILGQVKNAYTKAYEEGASGPLLNRLFQKSFQAAKWVRTHTAIGRGQVSVGTVAVDFALKIFGDLRGCRILVVGAGEISERTINALKSRGAITLTICNRTDQKAMDLAKEFGGSALPYQQFGAALFQYDIIICSTSSPVPVLTRPILLEAMKKRSYQPLFLIDLALPRDIDASVADIENVFLYNIDDLSQIAEENLAQRRSQMEHCQKILSQRANDFWHHSNSR